MIRHLVVRVAPDEVELASGLAWLAGAEGIEERPAGDEVELVVATADPDAVVAEWSGRWAISEIERDPDEWVESWKEHAVAVDVGPLVVAPPWVDVEAQPSQRVVWIDPGRAWGHGAHPTTRLVLDVLVADPPVDAVVLDLGCGSGVLGVVAAVLGSAQVRGCDVDPEAVAATMANAARNGVEGVVAVEEAPAEAPTQRGERAGLVLANIDAPVLEAHAAAILAAVEPGGRLVLSGMLDGRAPSIEAAYRDAAAEAGRELEVIARRSDCGWTALHLRVG